MSSRIYPDGADPATYVGLDFIYEFINSDGELRQFNCGQAAACTFLTFQRVYPGDHDPEQARQIMQRIEEHHPPDNFSGWFGTSRRRVERILRTANLPIEQVDGEDDLKSAIRNRQPVIVMCGVDGPKILGRWRAPAGHWMVVYGYDASNVFLTNWSGPSMTWDEFRRAWGALIPRVISMWNKGLTTVTQIADMPAPSLEQTTIV